MPLAADKIVQEFQGQFPGCLVDVCGNSRERSMILSIRAANKHAILQIDWVWHEAEKAWRYRDSEAFTLPVRHALAKTGAEEHTGR